MGHDPVIDPAISAPEIIEAPQPEQQESTNAGVARATGIIALGNISSRVLGLVREIILSNLFGAGAAVDAFKVAIIVPRSLYDLLIGGHVNSALIPVISDYANRENRHELWQLINALLGIILIALIALVMIIEVSAEALIELSAGGERDAQTLQEATQLLRITAPALIFLSLFAILSGLLYALRRFTMPAFGATVFNLMIVIITLALADQIGITAAAIGWLVGAFVQMAVQLPQLRDAKLWPSFRNAFRHPGVRTIGLLYLPVMASLALDVLVNRFFSYSIAFQSGESNLSYLDWATTLIQFPHGLVATAISVAVLPTLSRQAVDKSDPAQQDYKNTLSFGMRLASVLIIPATIGLFVLATPVVALIFEHGAFTAADTVETVKALRLYLVGLPFATIDLLLIFAFYARQDTLTPALIGVVTLIVYMIVALALLDSVGYLSLMIADSTKHILHSTISAVILWRRIGGLHGQNLAGTILRALIAATVMGLITYMLASPLTDRTEAYGLLGEITLVGGAAGVGAVVFLFVGYRLQLQELRWMVQFIGNKFRR